MNEQNQVPVTNDVIFNALMGLKGDVGGLKSSVDLQLEAIKNHGKRLGDLEEGAARNKGAAKVWAIVGSGAGAVLGSAVAIASAWLKHRP